jgi:hypothetical protein
MHPDFLKPFFLKSDAFGYAFGTILSPKKKNERLHLIAFYSRKFTAVEINYEIYDKELLTIVDSFQE